MVCLCEDESLTVRLGVPVSGCDGGQRVIPLGANLYGMYSYVCVCDVFSSKCVSLCMCVSVSLWVNVVEVV